MSTFTSRSAAQRNPGGLVGLGRVTLLGSLAVTAALAAAGCGGSSDSKSGSTSTSTAASTSTPATAPATKPSAQVAVDLKEYTVTPSSSVGKAGAVTFVVTNSGTRPHELVVIRTTKRAGSLIKGAKADETGNVGETGDLAAGAKKTVRLKLTAGHYALICNLPGHYASGQHIDFTVR